MDPNLVGTIIQSIAQQAAGMVGTLTPIGHAMASSFVILGISALGASVMFSPAFILPVVEFCMWASLALFFVGAWDQVIMVSLQTSNQILGMFIGGYQGPTDLFVAAGKIAQRLAAEPLGWGLSVEGSLGAMFKGMLLAVATPITLIGLCVPGLLALLAQLTLVVGALMGPIIVSGMAFSVTRPLAVGAVNFVITGTVRVVMLGLIAHLFAQAIEAQLAVPGTDEVITVSGVVGLMLTAVFAAIVGFAANGLAGSLVGGGVGSLGFSSFNRPAAALQAGAVGAGAVMTGAGAAARAGGGAAGSAVGAGARSAAGVVGRLGGGSPFPAALIALFLLPSLALAADPPARRYIVDGAFPGWEQTAAAALIDARCRSLRAPIADFFSANSAYHHCEGGVAQFLGLSGPIKTIDAPTLASSEFTAEQRAAVVKQTDQLEATMKAEEEARQKAAAAAAQVALERQHRLAEHQSAGMAVLGPTTHQQAMQARNEARVKRLAASRQRFLERQAKHAAARKVTVDANKD